MEEVFKASPELKEVLEEEKEFEDSINRKSFEESIFHTHKGIHSHQEGNPDFDIKKNIRSVIQIPRPALFLSLLFLLGVVCGFYLSSKIMYETEIDNGKNTEFSELIYYEEAFYE